MATKQTTPTNTIDDTIDDAELARREDVVREMRTYVLTMDNGQRVALDPTTRDLESGVHKLDGHAREVVIRFIRAYVNRRRPAAPGVPGHKIALDEVRRWLISDGFDCRTRADDPTEEAKAFGLAMGYIHEAVAKAERRKNTRPRKRSDRAPVSYRTESKRPSAPKRAVPTKAEEPKSPEAAVERPKPRPPLATNAALTALAKHFNG